MSGRNWIVTLGALACAVRQMTQGEEFPANDESACACVASTPVISKASNTQIMAIMRITLPVSSCPLWIWTTFIDDAVPIAPRHLHYQRTAISTAVPES